MRYRKLDSAGDYQFGQRGNSFYVDEPAAVAQAVATRLRLLRGEWFLDVTAGTPYATQVLGKNTTALYDIALRARILGTQGVKSILEYSSALDRDTRSLSVAATIDTIYGTATVQQVL